MAVTLHCITTQAITITYLASEMKGSTFQLEFSVIELKPSTLSLFSGLHAKY